MYSEILSSSTGERGSKVIVSNPCAIFGECVIGSRFKKLILILSFNVMGELDNDVAYAGDDHEMQGKIKRSK